MDGIVNINARAMVRLKVADRYLAEINWQGRLQAVGGGICAYAQGREFLSGLGFRFNKDMTRSGIDIRGEISGARLPQFEEWFIRSRIEASGQRELDPGRELIEELTSESPILSGLTPDDLVMKYLWTTKPSVEGRNKQRYMEVFDVSFTSPAFYDQILARLGGQARFVLISEGALTGGDAKLVSLVKGSVPYLAGAQLVED
jgi:hypothetical protein